MAASGDEFQGEGTRSAPGSKEGSATGLNTSQTNETFGMEPVRTLSAGHEPFGIESDVLVIDSNAQNDNWDNEDEDDVLDMQDENSKERNELLAQGILDEDTVGEGLSNLGRSADGHVQVFLHLDLVGLGLKDIDILANYEHLQKVVLPHNEITDLSPLSNMPHLLHLDVSHNELTELLDFTPPKNLKVANFAHNNITYIPELTAHHYLQKLVLDYNQITHITGLDNCKRLHHLSLNYNQIEEIEGLGDLPIRCLGLCRNNIRRISGIEKLVNLQSIDLAGNIIRSLEGLEDHHFLEHVDLEGNEVIDMVELDHVKHLAMLRELNLQRNPIRELPDYRLSVLFHLPKLTRLDHKKVHVDEKVAATNMFNPPLEVIAARDHIMHVVYSFLQPSHIYDSTLPNIETPYPMLVLVGPTGAGKKSLALRLVEEFPDYFGYGMCHTTQAPESEDQKQFHHVSLDEFEHDIKMGKFVLTYAHQGELYGLQMDSIEAVAREGLACVVDMELEGVLTLKNTYFEPRYVLVSPVTPSVHERRLEERGTFGAAHIHATLQRAQTYADYNLQHPGFFDMMINSDDITEAYRKLRRLVMDYLGISSDSPSVSEFDTGNTESQMGVDREQTQDTGMGGAKSADMARAWSKQYSTSLPSEALAAALANVKAAKARSPMSGGTNRGHLADQSMKRRASAAREAVAGQQPNIYDQIMRETPRTVPASVMTQLGLGDDTSGRNGQSARAFSAPAPADNMDVLPPNSPDSSDMQSQDDDSLSNISEAREIGPGGRNEVRGSLNGSARRPFQSQDTHIDRLELGSTGSENNSSDSVPKTPRPGSKTGSRQGSRPGSRSGMGSRQGSNLSGRPGSDRHPVLPPISPKPVEALPAY